MAYSSRSIRSLLVTERRPGKGEPTMMILRYMLGTLCALLLATTAVASAAAAPTPTTLLPRGDVRFQEDWNGEEVWTEEVIPEEVIPEEWTAEEAIPAEGVAEEWVPEDIAAEEAIAAVAAQGR